MEISGRPPLGATTTFKTASKSNSRTQSGVDGSSPEAMDREVNRNLAQARSQVEEARNNADQEIEHIKEEYEKESVSEEHRNQTALEAQRTKGYEALRDLQKQQYSELGRVRRDGETELSRAKTHYQNAVQSTNSAGARELEVIRRSTGQQINHEQKTSEMSLTDLRNQNEARETRARELSEAKLSQLDENSRTQYEKTKLASAEATERSRQHFQESFDSAVQEQKNVLDNLQNRASQQIKQVRQDTSQKLAAYSSRQRDPFYKMVDFDVNVHDAGENYVMTATIPEYEQKNVSVTLKGNQLVLAGHRRNEEKLDLAPGRSKGTASFQSFSESFPLPVPVDGKELTRSFEGDRLTVIVPKKPITYEAKPAEPKPERTKVERPKFPENLPHVERDTDSAENSDSGKPSPGPSPKTTGSRTLG